jgi:hypothetical protein
MSNTLRQCVLYEQHIKSVTVRLYHRINCYTAVNWSSFFLVHCAVKAAIPYSNIRWRTVLMQVNSVTESFCKYNCQYGSYLMGCDMIPGSMAHQNQCFRRMCCFHLVCRWVSQHVTLWLISLFRSSSCGIDQESLHYDCSFCHVTMHVFVECYSHFDGQ